MFIKKDKEKPAKICCDQCKKYMVKTTFVKVESDRSIRLKITCGNCHASETIKMYRPEKFIAG